MDSLPEDLQQMQDKINQYHKDEAFKKIVGKYYSVHHGVGYPDGLRRIYVDKNEEVRVDDYSSPKGTSNFEFKTWIITDANVDNKQHEFDEVENPKVWYNCLKAISNIPQLKSLFIEETLEKSDGS